MDTYNAVAECKVSKSAAKLFVSGIFAGAFIAFGALCSQIAGADTSFRVAQAAVFPIGLVMVVLVGAELFTGNNLLAYAVCTKAISPMQMLKNWIFVYLGNLAGSLFVAFLAVYGGTGGLLSGAVGETMISTAVSKCGLSVPQMLMRGILCNILVCIAVWNAIRADNTAGKVLAAFLPTFAFVLCGFEHCIANMYFIPAGMMAAGLYGGAEMSAAGAIVNILVVTVGNVAGGALLCACGLWYIGKKD